jgi:chromosome partitioning protein
MMLYKIDFIQHHFFMATRISILSNAGGAAKTTLATHLGYSLGIKGHSVGLLDLDPQGSLSLFTGLPCPKGEEGTMAEVFKDSFAGDWPLRPVWEEQLHGKIELLQSNTSLVRAAHELVLHERGAYFLQDRLNDYPLPHSFIIFDCPATLGPLPLAALAASTHVLIPCELEPKSLSAIAALITWIMDINRRLRLKPAPQIIGVVPSRYDARIAIHRHSNQDLVPVIEGMGLKCFAPIRYTSELKNASAKGLPLHLHRAGHPAIADFEQIVSVVEALES